MTPMLGIMASSKILKPTVTGGTLTSDSTYYYRTFTASGTLSVTGLALNADILTIAGGGGSGGGFQYYGVGGGGAGGLLYSSSQTIPISSQSITIIAGIIQLLDQ